ncbi:MAG: hypothetical protein ACTML1_10365, partial [Cellulosimicrobium funkei]
DQVRASALAGIPDLAHIAGLDPRDQARLYPALAIIRHLLATVAPGDDWSSRLVRLLDEFPADGVVSLSDMGLPDDWRARLS